jgi:hypothetical protein
MQKAFPFGQKYQCFQEVALFFRFSGESRAIASVRAFKRPLALCLEGPGLNKRQSGSPKKSMKSRQSPFEAFFKGALAR